MDYDCIRKLLGAALNAEGFGRGSGKLRYQEIINKPEWFDEVLEKDVGVTWECFSGVNTRFRKQKDAMYLILLKMYKFYLGDRVDEFCLSKTKEDRFDKTNIFNKEVPVTTEKLSDIDLDKQNDKEFENFKNHGTIIQLENQHDDREIAVVDLEDVKEEIFEVEATKTTKESSPMYISIQTGDNQPIHITLNSNKNRRRV